MRASEFQLVVYHGLLQSGSLRNVCLLRRACKALQFIDTDFTVAHTRLLSYFFHLRSFTSSYSTIELYNVARHHKITFGNFKMSPDTFKLFVHEFYRKYA